MLDFYAAVARATRSPSRRESYSRAKLAVLDGDLDAAERHYRAATDGFAQLDRPVMNSMCLGMVADFDERAGDYPAAITALEAAIATNEALLGGFTGSLLARLGWVLLHDGQLARAEAAYQRALDSARRVQHTMVDLPRPHRHRRAAPDPRPQRRRGRGGHRGAGASTGPAGPAGSGTASIPTADLQAAAAVCCVVLAAIAAEGDDPERAATLLGQAERLRADAGVEVPAFQHDDAERAQETARGGARRGRVRRRLRTRAGR